MGEKKLLANNFWNDMMDKQMKTIFIHLTFNITCFQVCVFGVTHLLYRPIGIWQERKGHLCTPEDWNYTLNTLSLSACWWEGWMISPAGPIKHQLLGCSELQMKDLVKMAKIVPTQSINYKDQNTCSHPKYLVYQLVWLRRGSWTAVAAGKHEVRKITFLAHMFIKEKKIFFAFRNKTSMHSLDHSWVIHLKKNLIFFTLLMIF